MGSMTAAVPPTIEAAPAAISGSQPPRKRRRRAPAAGAADDCFTCSSLGIPCDRRRPYCTQCLEEGKDCAGYKTTLTWGVGVASRGKLRGLSLPIAGTAKVAPSPTSPSSRRKASASGEAIKQRPKRSEPDSPTASRGKKTTPPISSHHSSRDGSSAEPGSASFTVPQNMIWSTPTTSLMSSQPTSAPLTQTSQSRIPLNLQPIDTPGVNAFNDRNQSASSMSAGFSEYSYSSPVVYPASSAEDGQYIGAPFAGHKSPVGLSNIVSDDVGQPHNAWPQPHVGDNNGLSVGTAVFLDQSQHDGHFITNPQLVFQGSTVHSTEQDDNNEVEETVYGHSISFQQAAGALEQYEPPFYDDAISDNSTVLSPYSNVVIGKTPRMQYLINYYAEVISPVIVAFDGPNNPYRTHILRLAMESETLQHAIAALSASNLRQRRENNVLVSTGKTAPARRASMAHSALTDQSWQSGVAIISPEAQAREELLHKSFAIQSLNGALADPIRRKDDSILATLLILCLFHICDSGVAKFQTQFAGVKKLLGLRSAELAASNKNSTSPLSKETIWYTRMFTWFDAFTATVNDREGQLQGTHLDISSLSDEEWALENLAGCDGRLFKIIAKLGRLNVLSQNGQVEAGGSPPQPPVLYPQPYPSHLDINGWGNMHSATFPPASYFPSAPDDIPIVPPSTNSFETTETQPAGYHDNRSPQFWDEWSRTRNALLSWHLSAASPIFSPTNSSSTLSFSLTLDQKADLLNISESFRYSGLLYLERLALPHAPSSDPRIQSWVSRALTYIKLVKSDVYLLWPLFITGSECVQKEDRQMIRQRCLDIQKDSGFMNNWSTLELLEKVWARNQPSSSRDGSATGRNGTKRKASGTPENDEWEQGSQKSPNATRKHGSARVEFATLPAESKGGFRWRKVMDLGKSDGEYIVV